MTLDREFDVVILGSGFGAFEIATALARTGRKTGIIEAGPERPDDVSAARSAVPFSREAIRSGGRAFGAALPAGFETAPRCIALGGTSVLWSGKWRPIDRIDMARTHGDRQWPFQLDALQPYFDRLRIECAWPGPLDHSEPLGSLLEAVGLRRIDAWEETPPRRLQPRWLELAAQGDVTFRCNSSVLSPVYGVDEQTIEAVRVSNGSVEERIAASTFIVACGGIESVFASHQLRWTGRRAGAGAPDWYGGFMDHPKAAIGQLRIERNHDTLEALLESNARAHRVLAIGLPEREVAATGVGNHTLLLWPEGSPNDRSLQMTLSLEQFPESANRVHCVPTHHVAWRVSGNTWRDAYRFLHLVIPRLEPVLGAAVIRSTFRWAGSSHHIGGLPMGEPGSGAVDQHLRFHDTTNLYCASTACFPIAGSANPTLTLMALARRLADHLGASS